MIVDTIFSRRTYLSYRDYREVGRMTSSVHDLLPGQSYWQVAFCCPHCGELWGKRFMLLPKGASVSWVFEVRACSESMLNPSELQGAILDECLNPDLLSYAVDHLLTEYICTATLEASGRQSRRGDDPSWHSGRGQELLSPHSH